MRNLIKPKKLKLLSNVKIQAYWAAYGREKGAKDTKGRLAILERYIEEAYRGGVSSTEIQKQIAAGQRAAEEETGTSRRQ